MQTINWDMEFGKLKMEEAAEKFGKAAKELHEAEEEKNRVYFLPEAILLRFEDIKN